MKRNTEAPISEWPAEQLIAELTRLEADPGELDPWRRFKRESELRSELHARGRE